MTDPALNTVAASGATLEITVDIVNVQGIIRHMPSPLSRLTRMRAKKIEAKGDMTRHQWNIMRSVDSSLPCINPEQHKRQVKQRNERLDAETKKPMQSIRGDVNDSEHVETGTVCTGGKPVKKGCRQVVLAGQSQRREHLTAAWAMP
ncbi:predicted protein [Postia placenta Mad-698-R]|nr:predicted protein [Postia placenta Mad-698-R]